jgi:hypothetical protein
MPEYRIYRLTSDNHIAGVSEEVECASDLAVIEHAKGKLNGLDLEVWQGARVVTRLKSPDAK